MLVSLSRTKRIILHHIHFQVVSIKWKIAITITLAHMDQCFELKKKDTNECEKQTKKITREYILDFKLEKLQVLLA